MILFFQLPETPNLFGLLGCKNCSPGNPFLVLVGAGYFAGVIAVALLFPNFPNRNIAYSGLIWALLLAAGLTYLHLPNWCVACLVGHFFNILIWIIWSFASSPTSEGNSTFFKERVYFSILTPMIVVALFGCLNITFLIYNFKEEQNELSTAALKSGDMAPPFILQTSTGHEISQDNLTQGLGTVINFVMDGCPYCKDQLQVVNKIATELAFKAYRFINVSPTLTDKLTKSAPSTDWVEDKEGYLHSLFKVKAYPTLFIVGNDGKIRQVILGVPENLEEKLPK